MPELIVREIALSDKEAFIEAMNTNFSYHSPWVKTPQSAEEFDTFYAASRQPNKKSYIACDNMNNIVGVFNLSDIIYGAFESAFMGYYGMQAFSGTGQMSAALKLVLDKVFNELKLHRVEANIQPNNHPSIALVKANGFRQEGYSPRYLKINGEWKDHERWAITLEDYLIVKDTFN